MTTAPLPTPSPERTPETDEFWDATSTHRLLLPHCDVCGSVIWYPRALCPACGCITLSMVEADGRGTVYSFTVVHRSADGYRDVVPFVVAYVELTEGPRVLTNIVGCDPDDVYIGQPVNVVFHDTEDGSALYRFGPAD